MVVALQGIFPTSDLVGRVSRHHDCRDAAGEPPRALDRRLLAPSACGMERVDTHGPNLPVLSLCRWGRVSDFYSKPT